MSSCAPPNGRQRPKLEAHTKARSREEIRKAIFAALPRGDWSGDSGGAIHGKLASDRGACHIARVSGDWNWLLETARAEVEETLRQLPADLRRHAEHLAVTYESTPGEPLLEDGWDEDLLGMFVGDPVEASELSSAPRQILLFLENIWDFAETDPRAYREEVRITYIHEFGHYLGLDEAELEARGLL